MALENINCPQFVDFTSDEPFNINDGADFCFEKEVVGEGISLGSFNTFKRHSEGANILSNSTNLKHSEPDVQRHLSNKELSDTTNKKPITKPYTIVENNKQVISQIDKENEVNINKIVGETKTIVSSAIELISVTKTTTTAINTDNGKVIKLQTTTASSSTRAATASTVSSANKQKSRQRNHSVASTVSNASSNNISSCVKNNDSNNKMPVSNNIVKKTLAKVTAAFKTNSKSSQVAPVNSIDTLKKKLTSSKKTQKSQMSNQPGIGPIKVEHHSRGLAPFADLGNRPQSPTSNRRCSSVPRTLKEKQALNRAGVIQLEELDEINGQTINNDPVTNTNINASVKLPTLTTTLSDKIQSFFNSHTSNYASATKSSINKSNILSNLKQKQPILANKNNLSASKTIKQTNQQKQKTFAINESALSSGYRHRSRSIDQDKNIPNKGPQGHNPRSRNNTSDSVEIKTNRNFVNNNINNKLNNYKPTVATSPNLLTQNLKSRQKSADKAGIVHQPMYTGVKFIPKLSNKYQNNSVDGFNGTQLMPNLITKNNQYPSYPVISNKKNPIEMTASSLIRSTSGKSASFNKQKPSPLVSTLFTAQNPVNIHVKNHFTTSSSNDNINGLNLIDSNHSTNRMINLNDSTASSNNPNNLSRKKSENKPIGLHTELRAMKRNEYDQTLKEKERIASLIKKDLELEKMKKQHEEIQKIRMQRTVRSKPLKANKPTEMKTNDDSDTINTHVDEKLENLDKQILNLNLSHDNLKLDY